ncbi:hypothetical protein B9K02_12655, partial [Lentilactobacillus kefiri]
RVLRCAAYICTAVSGVSLKDSAGIWILLSCQRQRGSTRDLREDAQKPKLAATNRATAQIG